MSGIEHRILVTDEVDPRGVALLQERPDFQVDVRPTRPEAVVLEEIGAYDAFVGRSATRISAPLLERGSKLRVVGRAGVGVDNVDLRRATELGIAVINAPGGNTVSVAELAFGLLLGLMRKIPEAVTSMRAGRWDRSALGGAEVRGRTLVIVGLGRIGAEMARRARAFGMRVVGVDPYVSRTRFEDLGVERAESLEDALPQADVITLHIPLTSESRDLIGAEELALLPRGAILLNLARGGVVEENALADALQSGALGGAALDVFATEPLPADHPLRPAPNVLLTPHLGASTGEAQQNVAVEACAAVRDALLTGDLSAALNGLGLDRGVWSEIRPLAELCDRMGRLGRGLLSEGLLRVELRYAGPREEALRPLAVAALRGVLLDVVDERAINFVNALHVAEERGIETAWTRVASRGEMGEDVELVLHGDGEEIRLGGAVLGGHHARIHRIGDFHVDIAPRGTLLVLRNRDVPGVIGRVGTILGEAGVNIAEYHQARLEAGGDALAAVSVDGTIDETLHDRLLSLAEVTDLREVAMG